MLTLHFIESHEEIPTDWESNPELKEGAEKYRDHLIREEISRMEYESNHSRIYISEKFPIIDKFTIRQRVSQFDDKYVTYKCVEYELGQKMFLEWKWATPEVQKAYFESKVAGTDWYTQFETNPEWKDDYLDGISDSAEYIAESKKVENGIKVGKYENR